MDAVILQQSVNKKREVKHMKKATVIVLVLALLVSIFAACQPKTPDNPGENSNKPEGTTAKAPET